MVNDLIADFRQTVDIRFTGTEIPALDGIVE